MTLSKEEATGLAIIALISFVSYQLGYRKSTRDLFRATSALRASIQGVADGQDRWE